MRKTGFLFISSILLSACGESVDIKDFQGYGSGQPGALLSDGGEILLERIKLNVGEGVTEFSTFHAYQFMPRATDPARPDVVNGGCLQLKSGNGWPTNVLDGAQYVDWGANVTLTSADGTLNKTVPKMTPEAPATMLADNRPNFNRGHPFLYGGPSWQGDNLTASDFKNDMTYTVDVPGLRSFDVVFPPAHTSPNGIGTSPDSVVVPRTGDWDVTWPVVDQVADNEEGTHTGAHHFTFIAFAEVVENMGAIAVMICPAVERGKLTVSEADIATLPDAGVIQHGRLTHFMDDVDGSRFDLMAIDCTIGTYTKTSTAM